MTERPLGGSTRKKWPSIAGGTSCVAPTTRLAPVSSTRWSGPRSIAALTRNWACVRTHMFSCALTCSPGGKSSSCSILPLSPWPKRARQCGMRRHTGLRSAPGSRKVRLVSRNQPVARATSSMTRATSGSGSEVRARISRLGSSPSRRGWLRCRHIEPGGDSIQNENASPSKRPRTTYERAASCTAALASASELAGRSSSRRTFESSCVRRERWLDVPRTLLRSVHSTTRLCVPLRPAASWRGVAARDLRA
jgi:hypothetical protein